MEYLSAADMAAVVADALEQRICVSAWLGMADVLLLGFGEEILPKPTPYTDARGRTRYKHHADPPWELTTILSDWYIGQGQDVIGSSEDDPFARQAAEGLVGKHVLGSTIDDRTGALAVQFSGQSSLRVASYDPGTPDETWSLSSAGNMFYVMRADGTSLRRLGSEPRL